MSYQKPLRGYQAEAIAKLQQSLRSATARREALKMPDGYAGRVVLQLATGGGKTRIAAEIINMGTAKANGSGFPCIFCVPAISLIDQTVEAFVAEGITDIGVLQGRHPLTRPGAPIQVASVQTLCNRHIPPAKLIIVDECHRRSDWLLRQMKSPDWARTPIVGLSATPWTAGMARDWDDLIIAATTEDLIAQGYLSKFRLYAPSHPDLSGVKTVAGDYKEDELAEVMSAAPLIADAVQSWLQRGEGRPTLCFAVDCAHARKLCEQFEANAIAAEYMDAFTPREERQRIGQRLRSGATKVVCNVGVATTGVDWPWVSCLVLARPTQSPSLYVQIVGRCLRLHPQGGDSVILDHTDTALRLGLPTEIHYERLDDGKPDKTGKSKPKKKPLPKMCPSCGVVKPASVHKCPACGFAPAKQSDLEFAEGELAEVRRGPEDKEGPPQADRQRFFAMLVWEASKRGYKPGWVNHKYAEKFGYPPGRDIDRGCRPVVPDDACRGWIRSRRIAYAKAQEKARAAGRAA